MVLVGNVERRRGRMLVGRLLDSCLGRSEAIQGGINLGPAFALLIPLGSRFNGSLSDMTEHAPSTMFAGGLMLSAADCDILMCCSNL